MEYLRFSRLCSPLGLLLCHDLYFSFSTFLSQSVSSFTPLWSEKMINMISVFLNLLRLVLCPNIWSDLKNVLCALKKTVWCIKISYDYCVVVYFTLCIEGLLYLFWCFQVGYMYINKHYVFLIYYLLYYYKIFTFATFFVLISILSSKYGCTDFSLDTICLVLSFTPSLEPMFALQQR